jgi:hypothetical protein
METIKKIPTQFLLAGSVGILAVILIITSIIRGNQLSSGTVFGPTPTLIISTQSTRAIATFTNTKLPIVTQDIEISYSQDLKKFYVRKKTAKADQLFKDFLYKNNIHVTDSDLVYVNDSPVYYQIIQDEYKADPTLPNPNTIDPIDPAQNSQSKNVLGADTRAYYGSTNPQDIAPHAIEIVNHLQLGCENRFNKLTSGVLPNKYGVGVTEKSGSCDSKYTSLNFITDSYRFAGFPIPSFTKFADFVGWIQKDGLSVGMQMFTESPSTNKLEPGCAIATKTSNDMRIMMVTGVNVGPDGNGTIETVVSDDVQTSHKLNVQGNKIVLSDYLSAVDGYICAE